MYDRIVRIGQPGALRQYAGTFEGKNPWDLATIAEARQLQQDLANNASAYRGGLGMPVTRIVAIDSSRQPADHVPIETLIEAGFATDKPLHLQLIVEQGAERDKSSDTGGADLHPVGTAGGAMIEVFDACFQIGKYGVDGYRRVFKDLRLV